jgi:hypothetical protein
MSIDFICGEVTGCACTLDCEWPCFQRVGLTDEPCCHDCAPLPAVEDDEEEAA